MKRSIEEDDLRDLLEIKRKYIIMCEFWKRLEYFPEDVISTINKDDFGFWNLDPDECARDWVDEEINKYEEVS